MAAEAVILDFSLAFIKRLFLAVRNLAVSQSQSEISNDRCLKYESGMPYRGVYIRVIYMCVHSSWLMFISYRREVSALLVLL